jgi:very-short-patch-repair endonuclease
MIAGEPRSHDVARAALEEYRRKLLDLGGRNRFLNFSHRETARTQLRLVNCSPQVIFDLLESERELSIAALRKPADLEPVVIDDLDEAEAEGDVPKRRTRAFDPEAVAAAARSQGIDPSYDLPASIDRPVTPKLQTLLFDDPLKVRLQVIYDEAKRFIQELGINTLNCSLGFVEWYEADSSDRARFAPLLIVPIEMKRSLVNAKYQFHVLGMGEDPQNNPSLVERLVADFGIRIPAYEPEQTLSDYFDSVEVAIKGLKRWRVRRMATISLLNFAKLALYHDLDATLRPSHAKLESHPVVMDLICGTEDGSSSMIGTDENVDAPGIVGRVPLLVTEADASQFAAVADAMTGKSMVIEGPPGTGKSQTITNIIAAALAKGERVLFVAEKLAALDVVKSKLDNYGLGDFCLELHSTKARKSDVHAALKKRLNRSRERDPDRNQIVADLNQQKQVIQGYLDNLHAVYGKLGVPLHDLVWREQRMRLELPGDAASLEGIVIPGARDYDDAGISAAAYRLAGYESMFSDVCSGYGSIDRHPWNGLKSSDLKLEERQALIGRLRQYDVALNDLRMSITDCMSSAGLGEEISLETVLEFAALAASIDQPGPELHAGALLALVTPDGLSVGRRFIKNVLTRLEMRGTHSAETLGELANVAGGLREAVDSLIAIGEDNTALFGINERVTAIDSEITELEFDVSHLRAIVLALGTLNGDDLSTAVEMSAVLQSTSRRVITQRRPALLDEENAFDVRAASVAGRQLAADQASLEAKIDFRDLPEPSKLRAMTRILKEAGPLWLLNGEVRSARTLYKRHSLSKQKLSNVALAEELAAVGDHIERVGAFCKSPRNQVLFDGLFDALNTDFDFIESVVAFSESVRDVYKRASNDTRLRDIANSSSPDEIDAFIRLMGDARTQRILGISSSDWETELSREIEDLRARKLQLLAMESKTASLSVHKGLRIFEIRDLLQTAVEYRDMSLRIEGDGAARKMFEASFAALCENCTPLEDALEYFKKIDASPIPDEVKKKLRTISASARDGAMNAVGSFWKLNAKPLSEAAESLVGETCIDTEVFFGVPRLQALSIKDLQLRLTSALDAADALEEWLRFEAGRLQAVEGGGAQLVSAFESGLLASSTALSKAFEYCVIRTIVRLAIDDRPNLRGLAGVTLNEARRRFQELDVRLLELSRLQLAAMLDRTPIDPGNGVGRKSGFTGRALITLEVQKMKRHVAIRDLVQRSGVALQQLKPCFMMSPLSVAQYIPPGSIEFDLVVIDEASQMRPEDSLAALSRGKRAIIVGDQKQLPPTSFFERSVDDDDVADEDAVDNESVLDLALGQYGHSRRLRWHYRSRHESLIAFSNRYFYEDDLIVLPSPHDAKGELGVRSTFVESAYAKGRNLGEAEAVVEAVLRFMRVSSSYSVGVVAVNKEQRDLIQELLDRAIAEDEEAQRYVSKWDGTLYPYFVKNLESVQGDERDVMFISTVYGPEAIGGRVAQRFGPILGAAGWRRLNVLFTRARIRVELFTSMRPSDIRTEEGRSSRGLVAFRDYLEYAHMGRLEKGVVTARPPDSDFEIAVGRMLEAHGYEVVPQVGVDKYYVDLAVRHPRHGGFLIGIECDGATYHSSRSARDRDRTREEALIGLGWSLYRIWSTDWFANPGREFEKLDSRLRKLLSVSQS